MKTYLVTGAAGFIGANYIKYILAKHDDIKSCNIGCPDLCGQFRYYCQGYR